MDTFIFLFMQKPAYELRISDWSSDVCSSDLITFPIIRMLVRPHARTARFSAASYFGEGKSLIAMENASSGVVESRISWSITFSRNVEIGRASCRERVWQY